MGLDIIIKFLSISRSSDMGKKFGSNGGRFEFMQISTDPIS